MTKKNKILKKSAKPDPVLHYKKGKTITFYKNKVFLFFVLISVIRLWLTSDLKLIAILSTTDDFHYVLTAYYIKTGQWLGPLDQLTLHTRPLFAVFMAYLSQLKIPLLFSQQFLYVASVAFAFFSLRKFIKNDWILLAGYVLVIFNPMVYAGDVCRVVREGLWVPLSIITIFSFIQLLFIQNKYFQKIIYAVLGGLSMGAFYLTREDGLIIFPVAIFLCLAYIVFRFRDLKANILKNSILLLLPFILVKLLIVWTISFNYKYYEASITYEGEMKSIAAFNSALGTILQDTVIKGIPISNDTRMKLYEHVPAFTKLKPYEQAFMLWSEKEGVNKGELIHFGHALKWALNQGGYYKSYQVIDAFYLDAASDILKAIDSGYFKKIKPHPLQKYVPYIDLNKFDIRFLTSTMLYGFRFTLSLEDFNLFNTHEFGSYTSDNNYVTKMFKIVTNNPLAFTEAESTPENLKKRSQTLKNTLLQFNYTFYAVVTKYLFYLSLIAFLIVGYFSFKRKQILPLILLTSCLLIILIRIFILANFYSTNNLFSVKYLSIVYAFVFIHISFAFCFLFHYLSNKKLQS